MLDPYPKVIEKMIASNYEMKTGPKDPNSVSDYYVDEPKIDKIITALKALKKEFA